MSSPARHFRPFAAPLAVAVSLLGLAGQAQAQQARPGETLGLRYLSWAGKPSTNPAVAGAAPSIDGLRRARDAGPQPLIASAAAARPAGRPSRYGSPLLDPSGLTPASVWTGRPTAAATAAASAEPGPAPEPAAAAPPAAHALAASGALDLQPSPSLRRQDAYYAAPPVAQQAMQPTPQPAQHLAPPPEVPNAEPPANDPMAPRRDALIFRMGQPAQRQEAPPAPEAAQAAPTQLAAAAPVRQGQPPRQGARYYSVHRQAGQQPDPMVLPESVFIGGSTDLAEPPPVQTPARMINGRAQIVVPNADPSLP